MTSSYVLVSISNEEYAKLVKLHQAKGPHAHTLFTANLPLMWRTCNGAGVLRGTDDWEIDKAAAVKFIGVAELMSERKTMEGIVASTVNPAVVKKACVELAVNSERNKEWINIFKYTHPSDWLLALCYCISRMPASVSKDILGPGNSMVEEVKKLIKMIPSPQKRGK